MQAGGASSQVTLLWITLGAIGTTSSTCLPLLYGVFFVFITLSL